MSISTTPNFPSERDIVTYLEQYPLIDIKGLPSFEQIITKKIIKAVAKIFADQGNASKGVDMNVMHTMFAINEKLHLNEEYLKTLQIALTTALKDFLNEKKIEIKKNNPSITSNL